MEYYRSYEKRYKAAEEANLPLWGNSENDPILCRTLENWVEENELRGKSVVEFACGEGSVGIILSRLGVKYHGFDIAPTAVKKASERLREFPEATVKVLDMVKEAPEGIFDGAIDVMGLHMLVTDSDRQRYLKNACSCLKENAPMLFFRESYDENSKEKTVASFDDFKSITGSDYETPQRRMIGDKEIFIPLLPARAESRAEYEKELTDAGFTVTAFKVSEENSAMMSAADIYVRKR